MMFVALLTVPELSGARRPESNARCAVSHMQKYLRRQSRRHLPTA